MFAHHVHTFPIETIKGHQLPWNWSYRWLGANMWVLGIMPRSTGQAVHSLNHWAVFAAPSFTLKILQHKTSFCSDFSLFPYVNKNKSLIERHNVLVRRKLVIKLVSVHFYYYITQPFVIHVSFTQLNYDASSLQQSKVTVHHKEEVKKEREKP